MPIDFPAGPTTGQVYTYEGRSWVWNGAAWDTPRADIVSILPSLTTGNTFTGNQVFNSGKVTGTPADGTNTTAATGIGYIGIPQSSGAGTTGSYTLTAADAGENIYASATRTVTIPANGSVPLPVGTTVVFITGSGATMTIAITTDTMFMAGPGTTGTRTLAPFGIATAIKITSTSWIISGNGLS
jgi:hypothetical protein